MRHCDICLGGCPRGCHHPPSGARHSWSTAGTMAVALRSLPGAVAVTRLCHCGQLTPPQAPATTGTWGPGVTPSWGRPRLVTSALAQGHRDGVTMASGSGGWSHWDAVRVTVTPAPVVTGTAGAQLAPRWWPRRPSPGLSRSPRGDPEPPTIPRCHPGWGRPAPHVLGDTHEAGDSPSVAGGGTRARCLPSSSVATCELSPTCPRHRPGARVPAPPRGAPGRVSPPAR